MASIDDFLRSGELGGLSVGMSTDKVLELLGEPEDVSVKKNPLIWKYGSLQLTFYKSPDGEAPSLDLIMLYFHHPDECPPQALALNGWRPTGETTYDEFRMHLEKEGIPVVGVEGSGPDQHLVLDSGQRVTFDEGRLYCICFFTKREPKFEQRTINIRKSAMETIRREAAIQGISIGALCSRWVEERVASLQPH